MESQFTCTLYHQVRPCSASDGLTLMYASYEDGRTLYESTDRYGTSQPYILVVIKLQPSLSSLNGTGALSCRLSLSMLYFLDPTTPLVPSFSRPGWAKYVSQGQAHPYRALTSVRESPHPFCLYVV